MNIWRWKIVEVSDNKELIDLLDETNTGDCIHSGYRDRLIRHGDDGGWCIDTEDARVREQLERIRVVAGLPDHGEVFYLLVVRP